MNRNIELECKKSPLLGNQPPSSFLARDGEGSSTIPLREYTQVSGNGEVPEMERDIVNSLSKDKAAYYCYILCDLTKSGEFKFGEYSFEYEPVYVGMGRDLYRDRIRTSSNRVKRLGYTDIVAIKVLEGLGREVARETEKSFIRLIGRKSVGTGSLINKTVGGESNDGRIWTEQEKEFFSENNPMKRKEVSSKLSGRNNAAIRFRETNSFVSSNPMKDFETASKVNKIRRSKADPLKVSRAVALSNKTRPISDLTRQKLSLQTRLKNYRKYGNLDGVKTTLEEISKLNGKAMLS